MNILELGDGIRYGIRPESIRMSEEKLDGMALYRKGHVITREMLGAELQYKVRLSNGITIMVRSENERDDLEENTDVWVMAPSRHIHFFDKEGMHIGHDGPQELLDRLGGMNE